MEKWKEQWKKLEKWKEQWKKLEKWKGMERNGKDRKLSLNRLGMLALKVLTACVCFVLSKKLYTSIVLTHEGISN